MPVTIVLRDAMSKSQTPQERQLTELLRQIAKLASEADLSQSPPPLVGTPLPVAVSVEQAALLLGVAPSTLGEYIRNGRLKSFRMGRRLLIRLDSLHDFARDLETDGV